MHKYYGGQKDYSIVSAIYAVTENAKWVEQQFISYLDFTSSDKAELKNLFRVDLFDNNEVGQEEYGQELNDVINMISFYDRTNKEYVIAFTTNLGMYSYVYKTEADFATSNSVAYKALFLKSQRVNLTEGALESPASVQIKKGSLNYIDGELYFLTDYFTKVGLSNFKPNLEKTYISNAYKKVSLDTLLTNELMQIDSQQLGSLGTVEEKVAALRDEIKEDNLDQFTNTNSGDRSVGEIFRKSTLKTSDSGDNWDFDIQIDKETQKTLFPENTYGDFAEDATVKLVANEKSFTSRVSGSATKNIAVKYKLPYDLVKLRSALSEKYNNNVLQYDNFNHIIGQIYSDVQEVLEDSVKIKSQDRPMFPRSSQYWQINNWAGDDTSSSEWAADWGLFANAPVEGENGYYSATLSNINIKIGSAKDVKDYFTIGQNIKEEDFEANGIFKDGDSLYIRLAPINVKFKSDSRLIKTALEAENRAKFELEMENSKKEAQKIQFNGRGFNVGSSKEEIQWLLNKQSTLLPGYKFGIDEVQWKKIQSSIKPYDTTITVWMYDAAFTSPSAPSINTFLTANAIEVQVKILGLTEVNPLPQWIIPILTVGGMALVASTVLMIWFIARKRHYKRAVGKEQAKIVAARRKEAKKALKGEK
ncbi:hypothetical protein SCHIN_v1c07260 [Spiroplasma chinense]|uniref:Uncharacterized protein n=1 Tax=Spiroplasma chinense TaxID=216932 RepID=A0A5B9Y4F4_9MOLU|nr:hypothetical protein [Spiroplasma chinense]QEH61921.1 hypothetical protein SCHIN_v1c07260 [Spiroplasma chinense]